MLGRLVWLLFLSKQVCDVRSQDAQDLLEETIDRDLTSGCNSPPQSGPRIGMTVTHMTSSSEPGYYRMLWAALQNLRRNLGTLRANFSICVREDAGIEEQVEYAYQTYIQEKYDVILGPSNGRFNNLVKSILESSRNESDPEVSPRLILWSLPEGGYYEPFERSLEFLTVRVQAHHDASFLPVATGEPSRRLSEALWCPESVRDNDLARRVVRDDLPVLDINFDRRYTLAGLLAGLVGYASSIAFIYVDFDEEYREEEECKHLPRLAADLGFRVIEQMFTPLDPFQAVEWVGRDRSELVVWCATFPQYEFLFTLARGGSWQPKLFIASRLHAVDSVVEDVPVHLMNYMVEPSIWPSPDDLSRWGTYGAWVDFQLGDPSLLEHQLYAALQVAETLYYSDYLRSTVSRQDLNLWDFETQDVFTTYGRIRFEAGLGTRNGTCGFPALTQYLPYRMNESRITGEEVLRRYATNIQRHVAPNSSMPRSDVTLGGLPVIRLVYPQPSLWQKEIEVFPCDSGCEFEFPNCRPCQRGTQRDNDDLRCRTCPAGTYADIPGLSECFECPAGAQCKSTADEPVALPGYYKVRLFEPHIPNPGNTSDPGWDNYCSLTSSEYGRLGQGQQRFNLLSCHPAKLCLGGNRCFGHNTGYMCLECDHGFSRRHKSVDTKECRQCLSTMGVLWQLTQCALFLIVLVWVILVFSSWELRRNDAVKAPLMLAVVTHLHVRACLQEYISDYPDQVSEHAWHIYLSMILVRPFDLSMTDCLLDSTDPLLVGGALLDAALISYIVGLVIAFLIGPSYSICRSTAGIILKLREGRRRPERPRSRRQSSLTKQQKARPSLESTGGPVREQKIYATGPEKRYMAMYEAIKVHLCLLDSFKRCLVWTYVYYPILVRQSSKPYICRSSREDQQLMSYVDVRMPCDSGELADLRSRSMWIGTIFGLGFPLVIVLTVYPHLSTFYHISDRRLVGMLISGLKKHFWFWEAVKVLRTLVLILCALQPASLTRRGFALTTLLAFTYIQVGLEPHTRHHRGALPRAEAISSVCLSIMILAGWIEASLDIMENDIAEGTWVRKFFIEAKRVCLLVEKYGDVLFFVYAARALLFSFVVLPLHIASRTGLTFGRHIRAFLASMRWHYRMHSVGVVAERFSRKGKLRRQQDTYISVGSLSFVELRVMKLGISEVLQVAVDHHVRFHPMLIVNSLEQAAVRAGKARRAIELHREDEQDHGIVSHLMKRVLSKNQSSPALYTGRGVGDSSASFGSEVSLDKDKCNGPWEPEGFFTVDELYTAIQDVIMDVLERHPVLQKVVNVGPLSKEQERLRGLADEQSERSLRRPKKMMTLDKDTDEAFFEQLLQEHEARVRNQRLRLAEHAKQSNLSPKDGTEHSELLQMTRSAAQQVERMCTDTERWTKEARELQEALAERRGDIAALRQRLGHKGFRDLQVQAAKATGTSSSPTGHAEPEEGEDEVILQLLGPHAKPEVAAPEPRTELLSPHSREQTFLRAMRLQAEPKPGHPPVLAVADGPVTVTSEGVQGRARTGQGQGQGQVQGSWAAATTAATTAVVAAAAQAQAHEEEGLGQGRAQEREASPEPVPPSREPRRQEIPPTSGAGSARSMRLPSASGSSTSSLSLTRRRKMIWSPKVPLTVAPSIPEDAEGSPSPQNHLNPSALGDLGSLRPPPASTVSSGQSTPLSVLSSAMTEEQLGPAVVSALTNSSWTQSVWATPEARAAAAAQEAQRTLSPTRARVPPIPLNGGQ